MQTIASRALLLATVILVAPVQADDLANEVAELRRLLVAVQTDYESRISDLEVRLERAERLAGGARREAEEALRLLNKPQSISPPAQRPRIPSIPVLGRSCTHASPKSITAGTRFRVFNPAAKLVAVNPGLRWARRRST